MMKLYITIILWIKLIAGANEVIDSESFINSFGSGDHPIKFFSNSIPSFFYKYETLILTESFVTLSWSEPLTCDDVPAYYLVKIYEKKINTTAIGTRTTLKINRNETIVQNNKIYKIYVEARSNSILCGLSEVSLEFLPNVITVKLIAIPQKDICLTPSSIHFIVIWPKSDNKAEGSCICGLWTSISQCGCLREGNYYGVYNIAKDGHINICWSNITNNTIISVVFDSLNENSNISIPVINQEIYESYKVVIAEYPAPPIIEHDIPGLEKNIILCLIDVYDGNAPIHNYSISVTDNTGYKVTYVQNKISSRSCGNIPDEFSSCGPFNITVRSQNEVGFSKPNNIIVSGNEFRNVCKCISNNVNLTVSFLNFSDPQVAVLKISCATQYVGDNTFHVNVELTKDNSNQVINYTSVNCSTIFSYKSLQYSTTYSLHFKWTLPDGTNCSLINTANVFTTGSSPPLSGGVVAGIVIGAVVGVILFAICTYIVTLGCIRMCEYCVDCCKYKTSKYKTSPT